MTKTVQRYSTTFIFAVAVLALAVFPSLLPRANPFGSVVQDVAASYGLDETQVQMVHGQVTDFWFLRWTTVQIQIRVASDEPAVYVTARKGPFSPAYVSCYSVGAPGQCNTESG